MNANEVEYTVNLAVDTNDPAKLPNIIDILGRMASGLLMEGLEVRIMAYLQPEEADQ
ncbi:hypothetical protein SEA_KUWABARA_67 [Gordonia phage Kuwabara]|nr:hypothetical protein SEA_KUWABARA_67 [Gordonia phage Kuwabara]